MDDYYVYVYIDPRNYEEFYYGKGKDSRKDANHSSPEMVERLAEIRKAGCEPIVRVVARGLTESEAFLVEATLLWKLGRWTLNIASGHFADKFRPPSTLHRELPKFDFQNGFYYYNVGEGKCRNWDDYREFGIISAGHGARWRDAMLAFNEGDLIAAYLKEHGFVGVGKIVASATRVRDVTIGGKALLALPLRAPKMTDHAEDAQLSEYVCKVRWLASVARKQAKWKSGLYATPLVRASLDGQAETVAFLEREFGICLKAELGDRCQLATRVPQGKLAISSGGGQ
jgi:uncharacterized protein